VSDYYKYAAQNRLRFPSSRGDISVEDLFDLPLTSKNGFDLDSVAKAVNARLKAELEESFVTPPTNPKKKLLEISLEIVKDVIATKQEENAAALARAQRKAQKQKILEALERKKDESLSQASIDDLQKQLAELGD
jgi:hypothetical protein